MRSKRRNRQPYVSGYCAFVHGQHPCKGEVQNGSLVKPPITLCSCTCHGDYEARMVAAGQVLPEESELEEAEEAD